MLTVLEYGAGYVFVGLVTSWFAVRFDRAYSAKQNARVRSSDEDNITLGVSFVLWPVVWLVLALVGLGLGVRALVLGTQRPTRAQLDAKRRELEQDIDRLYKS